jgi:2-oxoglutarate ferredoxin oxidoreductase subunit alpha
MMENIGLGMMTETPCVVVDIQRAGPSTGLPTLVGQADVMQCRWGSHGDYGVIALCPASPQEMFDLTIEAFNLAEMFRQPVFVLSDEVVGHMFEKVVIPPADRIGLVSRKKPEAPPGEFIPFNCEKDMVPAMACAGEGYRVHVTGLTHDEMGYPHVVHGTQERLVRRLVDKIRLNAGRIIRTESHHLEDADTVVFAYGCVARCAREAVERARARGLRVGLLRPITLWPFPSEQVRSLSPRVRTFIVPEINYGQMAYEVERCACGRSETVQLGMMGGTMHTPDEIYEAIEEFAR